MVGVKRRNTVYGIAKETKAELDMYLTEEIEGYIAYFKSDNFTILGWWKKRSLVVTDIDKRTKSKQNQTKPSTNQKAWKSQKSTKVNQKSTLSKSKTEPRRSRVDPTLLNDFGMATDENGDPPVLDLRTMEELCQPTLNGRGGPIAPIAIQATSFGLKNNMIQQV
uniref:Reverse transcriptase domain-containing protein n=1 Tax=Tanacetum cinerariifolium TaxID=118510 RepID=A0A6L2LE00_TANCI|nr:reverse transcriptase domain-containing protein [Tanacetum cinerariifolium]